MQKLTKFRRKLKKIVCFALIAAFMFGQLSALGVHKASAHVGSITLAQLNAKIDDLNNRLGGRYFNVGQNGGCGSKARGHSCSNCLTSNIVNYNWFRSQFGSVSTNQFPLTYTESSYITRAGYSCAGFASFAEWYIFAGSAGDSVNTNKVGTFAFNQAGMSNARIGDLMRLDNSHSVIFISADSSGIYVLDSNWSGTYNCMVQKHMVSYSSYSKATISRVPTNIITDNQPPSISNVKVSNVTLDGYTVTCNVSDNVGVTKVEFPTWTSKNGQDDLVWHQGSVSNGVATFSVKASGHKNEKGTYITHIYAWDAAGNKGFADAGSRNLAQLGSAQDLGTGFYGTITNTKAGTALTVSGTNVVANTETGAENQLWYFEKQSDSSYKITSKSTGKILDVTNGGDVDRTNVGIYQSNDAPCQRFKFFKANDHGYFVKANCAESTILDLAGNSSANGTNIQVYTIHKLEAEIFSVNKYYTVRFVNDNRTVQTQLVKSGSAAKAPEVSKDGCQCTWDKDISNITEDMTVKAVWNQEQEDDTKVVVEKVVAKSATNHKAKAFQYKFNKVANVDGYEFYYGKLKSANLKEMKKQVKKSAALDVTGLKCKNIKASSNSISVSKCTKNKTYYMTIRAYQNVDGKKVYGPYSAIKSVKIKN